MLQPHPHTWVTIGLPKPQAVCGVWASPAACVLEKAVTWSKGGGSSLGGTMHTHLSRDLVERLGPAPAPCDFSLLGCLELLASCLKEHPSKCQSH
jgi:hypothetical protein